MPQASKLGLGGHSFIQQLGNDPQPTFEEQCSIVSACLNAGIRLIDTTYYQERVALGKVLQRLGRRDEAQVMGWNFFKQPGKENDLVGYTCYGPDHLATMLEELQTDYIDLLVIHAHDNAEKLQAEMELAARWVSEGKVKRVGLGMVQRTHLEHVRPGHPVTDVLAPYNAFNRSAAAAFVRARELGLRVTALSPFIRGWKLDEIGGDTETAAGILLRWVASQDLVDHVIVSMRKQSWVAANVQAVACGPLTDEEQERLQGWINQPR